MFSTDEVIGVRPSEKYKFMIILSPTGPYYSAPMRIYVEEKYVRAVPGGVGYAKAAGNYGAAMFATAEAKRKVMTRYYGRMRSNINMCRNAVQ